MSQVGVALLIKKNDIPLEQEVQEYIELTLKPVVMPVSPHVPLQQSPPGQLRQHNVVNNCIIGSLLPFTTSFRDVARMRYIAYSL